MGWNLMQVPKVLHVYWGGKTLPLMRYMTVKSFSDLNPDWEIRFWRPSQLSEKLSVTWSGPNHRAYGSESETDYTDRLSSIKNLSEHVFEFSPPFDDVSDVFKSDYLRLDRLYEEGGFWSDMDIVFIRPMDRLYFNSHNSLITSYVCKSNDDNFIGHSIGFLGAAEGSLLFEELKNRSKNLLDKDNYQSVGRKMFDRFCDNNRLKLDGTIFNFDRRVVYPYDFRSIRESVASTRDRTSDMSIGIHWYAGDDQLSSCCKHVTESVMRNGGCTLYNEMRKFL